MWMQEIREAPAAVPQRDDHARAAVTRYSQDMTDRHPPSPPSVDTPERWGTASRGYAARVAPVMMRTFADAHINRLGVVDDAHVLEVAAGSGALTEVLAPRVKSLLATDFSPQMIEVLRERLDTAGIANVECRVMDGQALDLDANAFDAAACSFALMLFPDHAKGFSELHRVVRPGGRVVVSAWTGPDRFEVFGLILSAVQSAFPDMPPPPTPPPVFSLADPAVFAKEMKAAGFRDVAIDFEVRGLELPDFDAVWAMVTVGAPPVQVLFERIGPEGKERLRDSLRSIVADRFGDGPVKLTNVATIGSGVAS